jgi:vacuolar-type H+-ATPase subunit E/Vma4
VENDKLEDIKSKVSDVYAQMKDFLHDVREMSVMAEELLSLIDNILDELNDEDLTNESNSSDDSGTS